MGPRPRSCRDLRHTGRQPGGAAQYTARRPDARLAAAGRLPILGRLWAPGAFLRVPQERPAKHQPDHYRRGEPGGQADQHPRPRAHPAPQAAHPGHWPCPLPINTTSRADPLRPNAATGPRYVHALAPRPVPRRPAARRRLAGTARWAAPEYPPCALTAGPQGPPSARETRLLISSLGIIMAREASASHVQEAQEAQPGPAERSAVRIPGRLQVRALQRHLGRRPARVGCVPRARLPRPHRRG